MLKIGKINVLKVVDHFPFGFYLVPPTVSDEEYDPERAILLPAEEAPQNTEIGTLLDAFVYFNNDDRLVATLKTPKVQLGEVAFLTCKHITKVGAFMDWGLNKDLLVPYSEQDRPMDEGLNYAVYVFRDRETGRLAGTTKLRRYLNEDGEEHYSETIS